MKRAFPLFALLTAALLSYALYGALVAAPTEQTMGNVQRIFYYHVPSAWTAFLLFFINFIASIQYLVRPRPFADRLAKWVAIAIGIGACIGAFVVPLPEGVEWNFPASFQRFPSSVPEIFMAQPLEPGTFSMSMRSFLAECHDVREKTITVLSEGKSSTGGRLGYEELIREFSVYPNPNNGNFSVLISLSEEKTIRLKLIQFPTGIVVADYSSGSSFEHEADFELPQIPAGMYVVLLEVDSQQRFIRFMKK